jgi:hypothetical protein
VREEYDYIRKNSPNCKPTGQSLINNNGKPYDVIRVINQEGKEVSYYFDISSFYPDQFIKSNQFLSNA